MILFAAKNFFTVSSEIVHYAIPVFLILLCRWCLGKMKIATDVKLKKIYLLGSIMMVALILIWLVETIFFELPLYTGYVFTPLHYMVGAFVLIFALAFASYIIIKRYYIDND